jgi:hypothetical protein
MLVSEVRDLLKKYKEDDLRLLTSELYKAMPKKLREEKNIDEMLKDLHAYLRIGKMEKEQDKTADVNVLKPQIELFIDYAYKQYYFAPNNYVHKKERPKWRFVVKEYIRKLQSVPPEGEDGRTATDLLEKIYRMLSYACHYYIFSTDNPFRSVGMKQTELLDAVIARKLGNGISKETVRDAAVLVLDSNVDRETLYSSLACELIANLRSPAAKEMAVEQCIELKRGLDAPRPNPAKKSRSIDSSSDYERKERIENLVELVFRLKAELCEYEDAISYYKKHNVERDEEVALFVLFHLLQEYGAKVHWLKEYKKAQENGIKLRAALHKTYRHIQEKNEFPEYHLY